MSSIHLLDARAFPAVAARNGIRQTARALTFAGKLLPINVGRRTYYRWADVLDLMPGWARAQHAGPVVTAEHRPGLAGHTVTIEAATRLTAHRLGIRPGALAAVERSDGWLSVLARIPDRDVPERFAEAYARSRGAAYIPAGGAQ